MLMVRFTQEPQEDERFSETVSLSLSLSPRERELELLRGVTALVFVRLGGQQGTVLPCASFWGMSHPSQAAHPRWEAALTCNL